jgi:hypothetical protein
MVKRLSSTDQNDTNLTNVGSLFVDYIGGNTDSNVDFDVNGNFLGTLKVSGTPVSTQKITVSSTAPSSPATNDLWVDTN